MPSLRDTSVEDLLAVLPDWQILQVCPKSDVFVGAVGFEDRAIKCFQSWCNSTRHCSGVALLVTYPESLQGDTKIIGEWERLAGEAGVSVTLMEYDRLSIYGALIEALRSFNDVESVFLDVSALASFLVFPMLAALFETVIDCRLYVGYCESLHYYPSEDEWLRFQDKVSGLDALARAKLFDDSYFQSRGVETVYESLMFPGRNLDNFPTSLVAIPNFSFERVNRMIEYASERYGASRERVAWVFGMPPNKVRNGWRNQALCDMYDNSGCEHHPSTFNYREIVYSLHQIWEARRDSESLVIATLGSKAQHLGTFLFLRMHSDVGLIVSEPQVFNVSRFSSGAGRQWLLDFGTVGSLLERLDDWNAIAFEW